MNPLRQWRNEQKLRAVDIAHRLEVSERTILAWEHGAFKPSSEAFGELARLLDVQEEALRHSWIGWLAGLRDDGNNPQAC